MDSQEGDLLTGPRMLLDFEAEISVVSRSGALTIVDEYHAALESSGSAIKVATYKLVSIKEVWLEQQEELIWPRPAKAQGA